MCSQSANDSLNPVFKFSTVSGEEFKIKELSDSSETNEHQSEENLSTESIEDECPISNLKDLHKKYLGDKQMEKISPFQKFLLIEELCNKYNKLDPTHIKQNVLDSLNESQRKEIPSLQQLCDWAGNLKEAVEFLMTKKSSEHLELLCKVLKDAGHNLMQKRNLL